MIEKLAILAIELKANGFFAHAKTIDKLIIKLATTTRCIAVFKYPIEFANGGRKEIFDYKSNSYNQLLGAIPHILSKKHSQVWFLKRKYELPAQANLLASKLIEEKMLGNIECECYIDG